MHFKSKLKFIWNYAKRHLRFFTTVLFVLLLALILLFNWRLYHSPEIRVIENDTVNYDALCQLRYLRDAMEKNAANEMQHLYPEGYVFFNALYGLSWCDLAEHLNTNSILYQEAHVEIQRAFNNINSKQGRVIFDDSLPLPYGSFYNGWLTWLLAKKLSVEPPHKRDAAEVELFHNQCMRIANVIDKQTYPETYYGSSWPADVVLCVAALAKHDKLYTPLYQANIQSWWQQVNRNLDSNGLIPHSARANGKPLENARGSSQSLMQCFLPEIIPGALPANQPAGGEGMDHGVDTYRTTFSDTRFGLPGIREYPEGKDGYGDIDSGPVILGMGGAATIVGIRAMKTHGLANESIALRNSVEALALPIKTDGRKKYLLGKLPIADVFITWAQGSEVKDSLKKNTGNGWRGKFQVLSGVMVAVMAVVLIWMWWRK